MSEDYGGMSISDWNSAKLTVQKHLGVLATRNPDYRAIYDTALAHLIVDIFMVQQSPKNMSIEEFLAKYTTLFKDGFGVNFHPLDTDGNG